jgi:hypothetical protein
MKKIKLQNALVLLSILSVLFSCRKEPNKILNTYENPAKISKSYPVTDSDLKLWQSENPVAKFLALDWKNAKHITIDGKPVVKVALLNESRMPVKNKQVTSTNNIKALSSFNAIFEKHPPEVYFVQNSKDSLHTYLLNFIPDNLTKEFGQNKVWSGKLYEWNMNSDSLFVHEYKQNKVINRFILKGDTTPNLNANNQIKTDSFWSWLVDTVGDVLNAIGYLLHIPGTDIDSSNRHPWGNTRGWPSFDWFGDIFGGGGGGGSGGCGFSTGGGGSGSTGGSGTYYGGSTGGSGGSTGGSGSPDGGTPSGWSGDGGLYNEYLDDDPGYSVPVVPTYSEYLIDILNLTNSDLIDFISNGSNNIDRDLALFLRIHGETQANIDFVNWALTYLKENTTLNVGQLLSKIGLAHLDLNDPLLLNKLLRVDLETRVNYPKFSHLVDNMDKTVKANPKVLSALIQFSGMTESQILADLKPGQGPLIKIQDLTYPREAFGKFNSQISETTLFLNIDDVSYFEQKVPANYITQLNYSDQRSQAIAYVLALTTLHEYVHYGRYTNNLYVIGEAEFGEQFEIASVGFNADYHNMYDLKIKFKLVW